MTTEAPVSEEEELLACVQRLVGGHGYDCQAGDYYAASGGGPCTCGLHEWQDRAEAILKRHSQEALAAVSERVKGHYQAIDALERQGIVDAFAAVGVTPEQLAEYLAGGVDMLHQRDALRRLVESLRAGRSSWADVMKAKREFYALYVKASAASPGT